MALFNRQKNPEIPPELQPYYELPSGQKSSRRWLRWIGTGVAVLVAVVLLGFLIHWAYREAHSSNSSSSVVTNQSQTSTPKGGQVGNSEGGSTSQTSSGSSATNHSSPKPPSSSSSSNNSSLSGGTNSSSGSPKSTSQTLSNSGPGNTVGLFVFVAVAGAVFYQLRLRRRLTD